MRSPRGKLIPEALPPNYQFMNTRFFLLLTLALPLTGCASLADKSTQHKGAALGQSHSKITKELGPPTAHYMNGFDLFHDSQGNEVQAHFQVGKADSLLYYTFKKKIDEHWLSSVLSLNPRYTLGSGRELNLGPQSLSLTGWKISCLCQQREPVDG